MTLASLLNFIRKSTLTSQSEVNRLLEQIQEISDPIIGNTLEQRIIKSGDKRIRTSSVGSTAIDYDEASAKDREHITVRRQKPDPVYSYPLVHAITGTETFSESGHKWGGNGKFNGSSYITITDHANLDLTTDLTISFWGKFPNSTGTHLIASKNNAYQVYLDTSNTLKFRIYSGGAWKTALSYTYTANTWTHIACVYESIVGQELYVNGSLNQSDSETGSIATNTNDLKIGGDGTSNLPNNSALSWLTILNGAANLTWVSNLYNYAILDTATYTEVTTIPFQGTWAARPDATAGESKSYTTPPAGGGSLLLEDGSSYFLLEDGVSKILLE